MHIIVYDLGVIGEGGFMFGLRGVVSLCRHQAGATWLKIGGFRVGRETTVAGLLPVQSIPV